MIPHLYVLITKVSKAGDAGQRRYDFEGGHLRMAGLPAANYNIEVGEKLLLEFMEFNKEPCVWMFIIKENFLRHSAGFGRDAISIAHPDVPKEFLPIG